MKRLFLIFLFLLIACPAWGVTKSICSSGCDYTTASSALSGYAFQPDDVIELRADTEGGEKTFWDAGITWNADSGTSGHPIVLKNRTGDTIILSGSPDTTGYDSGWADDGDNVWHRTVTTQPNIVVYDGSLLTLDTDTTPSVNKWYWASNVLYVNVGGDPSSTTKWRIGKNQTPLLIQSDYVTVQGIQIDTSNNTSGGVVQVDTQIGIVLDDLTVKYGSFDGIYLNLSATNNSTTVSNSYVSKISASGISIYGGGTNSSYIISDTSVSDGFRGIRDWHGGVTTATIQRASVHDQVVSGTTSRGIHLSGNGYNIEDVDIYNIGDANNTDVIGLYSNGSNHNIKNASIHDVKGIGILLEGSYNTIKKSIIYNIGYITGSSPYTYPTSFLKYGNGGSGDAIRIGGTAAFNNIYDNHVWSSFSGISIATTGGSGGNAINYNIVSNMIVNGIGDYFDGNPTNRNVFYNNTVYHNPSADNVSAYTGHGFHIQDVGAKGAKVTFANNACYNAAASSNSHCFFVSDNGGITNIYLNNNDWYSVASGLAASTFGNNYNNSQLSAYKTAMQANAKIADLSGVQANAESNTLFSDPLFISNGVNFHLQSGSPARGAGVNVGLSNTDPPDIGAEPYNQYVPWVR